MASAIRIFRTADESAEAIVARLQPAGADVAAVQAVVDAVVARVRAEGDAAVLAYTREFDWAHATLEGLRVTQTEIDYALSGMSADLLSTLTVAAENIRNYHKRQMPQDWYEEFEYGLMLGQRHVPLDSVACYVPTRKASLPSSLLMSVVPAQAAGVERIVVVGPCDEQGRMPDAVLGAASMLGITEIYKLGGAVAVAAMAYGTATFPRVDKIVGPTNLFGTLAKKAVFGDVGIDGLNGPSDVTILADGTVPATWVALDLLSQAEHGEDSGAVLVTPDAGYAARVAAEVEGQLAVSPRARYLTPALARHGGIIVTHDLVEAARVANLLAAEHLEIATAHPNLLLADIRRAGAIFLGGYAPVPVGDYLAGPSHVLPTGRTARFANGLGVTDFLTRNSLIGVEPAWLRRHGAMLQTLAEHEGLDAHAKAVQARL